MRVVVAKHQFPTVPITSPMGCSSEICDALLDLVPFVQFKKLEKHTWRSVNFSKVAG